MPKNQIIAGLDIGTGFLKMVVVRKNNRNLEILSQATVPSFGLRKGAVVDVEETAKNIQILVSEIKKTWDRKINSVFVNIGGSHLHVSPSDGTISVSRADQKISHEDIERVIQATRAINLPSNEEILDVFPREFIIDGQAGIKEPLGLSGIRLEAKVLLLRTFSPYFLNLTQAVLNANLKIDDIIPSPLAAAAAVLTPQQKELGTAVVDIGASTTSLAVFEEGGLLHLAILPIGSANITNDIAIGLRTEIGLAEKIKKEFGNCFLGKNKKSQKAQDKKKIESIEKTTPLVFSQKTLVNIIEPRVSEIFELIQKELKKIGKQELLPGGIVLTGGGAKLPKIEDLARQHLRLPCEIGVLQRIKGLEKDPGLATVCGLVLEGADSDNNNRNSDGQGIWAKLKKVFRIFIP